MLMDKLLAYLNNLSHEAREEFAKRCGTTVGYLRKASSVNQRLGEILCMRIGFESNGDIKPEDLRPDLDWDYLRASLAGTAQAATEAIAADTATAEVGSLRSGGVRRHASRRAQDLPIDLDRRAKAGPPFQALESGVA